MWMVGYNEGGDFGMADYALNGRKLRPLMPRPVTSPNNTPNANSPCLNRIHHGNDFFSQYHNMGMLLFFNFLHPPAFFFTLSISLVVFACETWCVCVCMCMNSFFISIRCRSGQERVQSSTSGGEFKVESNPGAAKGIGGIVQERDKNTICGANPTNHGTASKIWKN